MLGNFVSRVTKFCRSKFGETVPEGGQYGEAEAALTAEIQTRLIAYEKAMEDIEIRKATAELRAIWVAGNEYLQHAEPWARFKTDPDAAASVIRMALNLIRLYAVISRPFIPDASDQMLAAINLSGTESWPDSVKAALTALPAGHAFTTPDVLFAKIADEAREELEARFAGS